MKRKVVYRVLSCLLCCLLGLMCGSLSSWASSDAEAERDLSTQCSYSSTSVSGSSYIARLRDDDLTTHQNFHENGSVTVSWSDAVAVDSLFIEWNLPPDAYLVTQLDAGGAILTETAGRTQNLNELIYAAEGARSIRLSSAYDMDIAGLHAYAAGDPPHDYHAWEPLPDKLDYLVLSMHPDDDTLFLGGAVATLCDAGYTGTIAYLGTRLRERCTEALNGAWIMGVRYAPILAGFPDIPPQYREQFESTFTEAELVQYLVRLFRQYRPELIVTQDVNGEYGHWQHILLVSAVQKAVPLANDASFDPDSAAAYGVYEVKKLYLHLYTENAIHLNVTTPLASFGGKTAVEVAKEAYGEHLSQQDTRHSVTNEGIYSLSDFGLAYSTVGLDTGSNELMEHIDASLLCNAAAPTEAPSLSPSPSAAPTQAPCQSLAPTAVPAAVETNTPAPTSEPLPSDSSAPAAAAAPPLVLLLLGGLVLLLILACIAVFAARRRRS